MAPQMCRVDKTVPRRLGKSRAMVQDLESGLKNCRRTNSAIFLEATVF